MYFDAYILTKYVTIIRNKIIFSTKISILNLKGKKKPWTSINFAIYAALHNLWYSQQIFDLHSKCKSKHIRKPIVEEHSLHSPHEVLSRRVSWVGEQVERKCHLQYLNNEQSTSPQSQLPFQSSHPACSGARCWHCDIVILI